MTAPFFGHTLTKANADLDALIASVAQRAPSLDAIPVVASVAARNAAYPTPAVNQRVQDLATGSIERWNGVQWVTDANLAATISGLPLGSTSADRTAQTPGGTGSRGANYVVANYSASLAPLPVWQNINALEVDQYAYDGGFNELTAQFSNKTFWHNLYLGQTTYTPGQHWGLRYEGRHYSVGDSGGLLINNIAWGGTVTSGDEGIAAADLFASMGQVEYQGAITAGAGIGSTGITVNPTQGAGTQGAGRFLVNATQKVALTISAMAGGQTVATTLTTTGHGKGASTVTTLGTAVAAPGAATVTPASMTGIGVGSKLVVAGASTYEVVVVTAVTATTFTATFRKSHAADHIVAAGGAAGYFVEFSVDNASSADDGAITGTLHYVWPVLYSNDNTSLVVWLACNGGWSAYAGRWSNVGGRNGGFLYPGAEIVSVQAAGVLSNALTLAPNPHAWTNGDTVMLPIYPAVHAKVGTFISNSYFPTPYPQANLGLTVALSGIPNGRAMGIQIENTAPESYYPSGGGFVNPPLYGVEVSGFFQYALHAGEWPSQSALRIEAIPTGRTTTSLNVLQVPNTFANWDFIAFKPSTQEWTVSTGQGGTATYYVFGPTGVSAVGTASMGTQASPFTGLYLANSVGVRWAAANVVDTGMDRNAAGVVEVNNGTPGTLRDFVARTLSASNQNGAKTNVQTATALVPTGAGGSVSASNLIPAGCVLLGVSARVVTPVTGTATSFSIGDGTTADLFASTVALAGGTTTDLTSHKATWTPTFYLAARSVVLTANGGTFSGGQVRIVAHYQQITAPTS